MEGINVSTYTTPKDIPVIDERNFFHSRELFCILYTTRGCTPYMLVATDETGAWLGHILATIYRRGRLLPPYLYSTGRVTGEGVYKDEATREAVFPFFIKTITQTFTRRLCLFIEFSHLSKKMLGFRHFRQEGYVPFSWHNIHNSLHSKSPTERVSQELLNRIVHIYKTGVETRVVESQAEFDSFYKLLRNYYRMKFQRFIPKKEFFMSLLASDHCSILVTLYKGKVIGGTAVIFNERDAYLWYSASLRKSYHRHHPRIMNVWYALNYSYDKGKDHLRFMHVGLPYFGRRTNEFLLEFGGKPTSTYRWFRSSSSLLNKVLRWLVKE